MLRSTLIFFTASTLIACTPDFPALPNFDAFVAADEGFEGDALRGSIDSAFASDGGPTNIIAGDALVTDAQGLSPDVATPSRDMGGPSDSANREDASATIPSDAGRRPPIDQGRRCPDTVPADCDIDCADDVAVDAVLWVAPMAERTLQSGQHVFSCVVVQGRLQIEGAVTIETGRFRLAASGRIEGSGLGNVPGNRGDGADGRSRFGRGSGGGGGSSHCEGGQGGELDDEVDAARPGITAGDVLRPGGRGGNGGDREGIVGPGGAGGASLGVDATRCRLAGSVQIVGLNGGTPGNRSDGGGGGGGAAGAFELTCDEEISVVQNPALSFVLRGGDGGRGGSVSGYHGAGGGGGAGGRIRLRAPRYLNRAGEVLDLDDVEDILGAASNLAGGRGGQSGHNDNDERGERGEDCELSVND